MAKLSADKKYVTVERGDTLSAIARTYGNGATYKQLAAINNISNPNRISVGQKIYLSKTSGGSSSGTTTSTNKVTINQFGLQSNSDNTLFATWSWSKSNTASYQVKWEYLAGGVWFVGSSTSNSVDKNDPSASRQSTYSIPTNAKRVRFKVKPISKTYTKNKKETSYWTAAWSSVKTYDVDSNPPKTPGVPSVEIDKFKLTAELSNIDEDTTSIQFRIVKNDSTTFKTGTATVKTRSASYSCTVDAGAEYKVRCRACKDGKYSEWSDYSDNIRAIPATPSGITNIKATSETSVYVEWAAEKSATSYDLEYTTEQRYFDGSDSTTVKTGIEFAHFEVTGMESGDEYFFRVRSVNEKGYSAWSDVKSITIGKPPSAPTTWSSTTKVIVGEPLILYWVHNSVDGSSQTYADLELFINDVKETHTIQNNRSEDDKDKTSSYVIDTSVYVEGTKIQWRVRTSGVTKQYGEWSVQRTIDVYAPPTLELNVTDVDANVLEVIESFPFYVRALPGPKTQAPIGFHLSITSNEIYETTDPVGNTRIVNVGEEVYSKYFDIKETLLVEFTPGNIDLENNISYTVTCTVSMNSGLTADATSSFSVTWTDVEYEPNAEIGIDPDTYVAHIRPYCETRKITIHRVDYSSRGFMVTDEVLDGVYGSVIRNKRTNTGEQVYQGITSDGDEVYYCEVEEGELVEDVTLSVYRREFDGSFVELATGLNNTSNTFVTDPHPALDYARYRIVAVTNSTGAVSYSDLPGYPVGCKSAIIQWDEEWSNFDVTGTDVLEQPPWSGSLLKLPYNIDVTDNHKPDTSLVEYIGRSHPVSYYGTQVGHSSSWRMDIEKADKENLYALRRLAKWMGDVYVREPSGSGYWANITVSFTQTHRSVIIPVTLDITRVEGGV